MLLSVGKLFESMEFVLMEEHALVFLHMIRLEHPSHLPWDGERQSSLIAWCFGQNNQSDTILEGDNYTCIVDPLDRDMVFHTISLMEGRVLNDGA